MDSTTSSSSRTRALAAGLLAASACTALYLLLGDVKLGLLDEGYLWYGVARAVEGQVPMRDFQAYDPGRYYWCVAWSKLFGEGLLGMRAALAVFRALGLACGLLAIGRVVSRTWALVPACLLLLAWMFPGHKVFEAGLSMIAVWVGVLLIEKPTLRRHLCVGVFVGLAGWFGRNHGLYTAVSFTLLSLYLSWKEGSGERFRRLATLAGGIFIGYAPGWIMLLFVPGFAAGLYESTVLILDKGVNVPRPFPWPWRTTADGLLGLSALGNVARSTIFLLTFLTLPVCILLALRTPVEKLRSRACFIAATFVGMTYLHHASVRSDLLHLAECVHPLLILFIALPCTYGSRRWPGLVLWILLALVTFQAVAEKHPLVARLTGEQDLVEYPIAGDTLRIKSNRAVYLARLEESVARHVGPEQELYIGPSRPMLYQVLGRRSPSWWISFFWQMSDEEQRRIIEELEERSVNWALIIDMPIDRREDLRFANATPLLWNYFRQSFQEVPVSLPGTNRLYRRRRR